MIEKIKAKRERGASQLLSILYVAKNYDKMERKIHGVPEKIDGQVARYALDVMGIRMGKMTKEQKHDQASS
ncbi:MAG TPA: hypothetical protein VFQ43_10075 [Nitrososphaera sp.]|nr:hypothetical protein [Nitrososphaera sp.]